MDLPAATLEDVLATSWQALVQGAAEAGRGFHILALATVAGDRPRSRAVVLRGVDTRDRLLRVHTDNRSDKCREIERNPSVALTGYDRANGFQLRIEGSAVLHHGDALAEDGWHRTSPQSRRLYGVEPPPGQAIGEGGGFALPEAEGGDIDAGQGNFSVIRIEVRAMEWLLLPDGDHRRARFTWDRNGALTASWLVP